MMMFLVKPKYLVEPPSVTNQTDWPCAFYELPDVWNGLPCCHFNCALANWHGVDWLITRTMTKSGRNYMSGVVFWLLKGDKISGEGTQLMKFQTFPDEHLEDPRALVTDDGRLFLALTCWRKAVPGLYAHQCFGEVNDSFEMIHPQHPVYGRNTNHLLRNRGAEKNWVYFQHDGLFHFVYSINPHTVCEVHPEGIKERKSVWNSEVWKWGEPRGGSPPVRVGDEYFGFFHSSMPWQAPYRRYFMGCYAFRAQPPFSVTRVTDYPLLFASEADPRVWPSPIVTFPCGSLLRDGVWTVTFGCNDCRSAWIAIPHQDLVDRMVAV